MRWLFGIFIVAQIFFDALVIDANTQRVVSDKKLCAMIPGAECSYFEFNRRDESQQRPSQN